MRVCPQGDAKGSGETKVSKLEVSVLVDEQVLGLEVAVEDAVGVAEVKTLNKLECEALEEKKKER